jgi:hypothetical protein
MTSSSVIADAEPTAAPKASSESRITRTLCIIRLYIMPLFLHPLNDSTLARCGVFAAGARLS